MMSALLVYSRQRLSAFFKGVTAARREVTQLTLKTTGAGGASGATSEFVRVFRLVVWGQPPKKRGQGRRLAPVTSRCGPGRIAFGAIRGMEILV